jgi:hypothetical protein
MRATTELLNLDFVFSQQKLLTVEGFLNEYKRRVLHPEAHLSSWEQLEVFHRVGALTPMYRFAKNMKVVLEDARQNKFVPLSSWAGGLNNRFLLDHYLQGASDIGTLIDPHMEAYQPWYKYIREVDDHKFWTSAFFYSHYQLLLIPTLRSLVPKFKLHRKPRKYSVFDFSFTLKLSDHTHGEVLEDAVSNTELVIALTALETKYLPRLRGHGHTAHYIGPDIDEILKYQHSFDPVAMLQWIGWDAEQVRVAAKRLLFTADTIDPLEDWYKLVRLCHPDKLQKLRGDALVALDHRVAAEILLRFYEDLVRVGAAPPFEPIPKFARGPYDTRLYASTDELDDVLTDFGLSPYPSLILVLEGETEWLLVPRVMDLLGIPRQPNFIELFKGQGVDTDFGVLASYVALPILGEQLEDSIQLTRPPTHFMVAVDPEKKFKEANKRERKRQQWIGQVYRAVPYTYRTSILRDELQSLVSVETWGEQSFEFAHFTDEELAKGIVKVYQGPQSPSLAKLQAILGNIRASAGNIDSLWEGEHWLKPLPRKTDLAEALWPVLEAKIRDAASLGVPETVPVVRVLLRAEETAATLPREHVIIRYRSTEQGEQDAGAV